MADVYEVFVDDDEEEERHMMEPPPFEVTARGFGLYNFTDMYGASASLQESSLATEAAVWLGLDKGTHKDGHCMGRMHVSISMAEWLIQQLQVFVDTGYLRPPAPDEEATNA